MVAPTRTEEMMMKTITGTFKLTKVVEPGVRKNVVFDINGTVSQISEWKSVRDLVDPFVTNMRDSKSFTLTTDKARQLYSDLVKQGFEVA
jgi:hypothetical protein